MIAFQLVKQRSNPQLIPLSSAQLAQLSSAKFSQAQLSSGQLTQAHLAQAQLSSAQLSQALQQHQENFFILNENNQNSIF